MAVLPSSFKLERYFAKHEFSTKYLLCCSDAEAMSMQDLLGMADEECQQMWSSLKLGYTDSKGHLLLRQEVANMHPTVTADDVLVIVPQEGIYIGMKCLVNYLETNQSTLHAITTYPAYQSLYENLRVSGCDVSYWTVELGSSGWYFDVAKLERLIRSDTKLLVVNFPHNPTGAMPSKETWEKIINICKERDIFLFCDEIYRLSNNDNSDPLPSACCLYANSMVLCGLSKSFALPGLRIGWLVTRNKELMQMCESFRDYLTICGSSPSEVLAIMALRNQNTILSRTLSIIKPNLDILDQFFARFPEEFEWHRPRACTTGFLRLKGKLLNIGKGGASGFCEALVQESQVLLLPSAMYDFKDDYVRVGFGRRGMSEALEVMRCFVDKVVAQ